MQDLKPLPMWEEILPVSITRLKQDLLEGKHGMELSFCEFRRVLPLSACLDSKLPDLINMLLSRMIKLSATCKYVSSRSSMRCLLLHHDK